jgi:hypothetical protein
MKWLCLRQLQASALAASVPEASSGFKCIPYKNRKKMATMQVFPKVFPSDGSAQWKNIAVARVSTLRHWLERHCRTLLIEKISKTS